LTGFAHERLVFHGFARIIRFRLFQSFVHRGNL
jgi:hypothetical protein